MDNEAANQAQLQNRLHLRPRSAGYYLNFTKLTKNIGNIATKGHFFWEFIEKDIRLPIEKHLPHPLAHLLREHRGNDDDLKNKKDNEDIGTIIKKSTEVLAEATTVFPLTLFPDTITLDRKKLIITIRNFFMSSKVLTIQIEEILNITVSVGPIFGALHIGIRGLTSEDHFDVRFLWRKDAIHLKHMIEGYIIALKDEIETDHLNKRELIKTLAELGRDSNPEKIS